MADPAVVLLAAGLSQRIAVCRSGDEDLAALLRGQGCTVVHNPDTARGMGSSLALGIEAVLADAAVVCLADMPNVSDGHIRAVIDAGRRAGIAASASDGGPPTPPAYFGRPHFADLMSLDGDRGARGLLCNAPLVLAPPEELADFDTPADFR